MMRSCLGHVREAVLVVEGLWLGWGLFFLLATPPLISQDLMIKNKSLEALAQLPIELVDEKEIEGPELPDIARRVLVAAAIFSVLQTIAIAVFICGTSRSSRALLFLFLVWIIISNMLIIGGVIYAAVQIDYYKDNIPPPPAMRVKIPNLLSGIMKPKPEGTSSSLVQLPPGEVPPPPPPDLVSGATGLLDAIFGRQNPISLGIQDASKVEPEEGREKREAETPFLSNLLSGLFGEGGAAEDGEPRSRDSAPQRPGIIPNLLDGIFQGDAVIRLPEFRPPRPLEELLKRIIARANIFLIPLAVIKAVLALFTILSGIFLLVRLPKRLTDRVGPGMELKPVQK